MGGNVFEEGLVGTECVIGRDFGERYRGVISVTRRDLWGFVWTGARWASEDCTTLDIGIK